MQNLIQTKKMFTLVQKSSGFQEISICMSNPVKVKKAHSSWRLIHNTLIPHLLRSAQISKVLKGFMIASKRRLNLRWGRRRVAYKNWLYNYQHRIRLKTQVWNSKWKKYWQTLQNIELSSTKCKIHQNSRLYKHTPRKTC